MEGLMRYPSTTSPYLQQRSSGYYFRFVIPVKLRPFIEQRELKYSLRTRDKLTARYRATRLASLLHEVLHTMASQELTPQRIKSLVHSELRRWMSNTREWELDYEPQSLESAEKLALAHENMAQQHRQAIATYDFSIVQESTLALLAEQGHHIPPESLASTTNTPADSAETLRLYRRVARELAEAKAYLFDILAHRNRGITGYDPSTQNNGTTLDIDPGDTLSDLWKKYTQFKLAQNEWKEATLAGQEATYRELIAVIGDIPANEVTRDNGIQFLQALQVLPKGSLRQYKGIDTSKLLEMDIPEEDRRSSRTIVEAMGRISSFFKWCQKSEGVINSNPVEGLTVPTRSTRRDPFTTGDLEKLFYSKEYRDGDHRKSWQFWMPLLALYTGARQNELAQLTLKDIIENDGIPAIDISDTEIGQSVKTEAGFRQVPIHQALLDIGFLEYVKALRLSGEERLFPDLSKGTRRWGQAVSQWWNRADTHSPGYMLKCGVDKSGGRKVFHSFRNTVITRLLREARIPLNEVQFLVGHETSMMGATASYYRGDFSDSVRVIKQLDFGLDHSFLKDHWKKHVS